MQPTKPMLSTLLTICICALLNPAVSQAWEPTTEGRNAGLKAGDLSAHYEGLTTWLSKHVPEDSAQITKPKMLALLRDEAFLAALAERQFISKVWDQPDLGGYAKADPKNAEFVAFIMSDPKIMDDVMLTRTPTAMFARYDNSWSINTALLDNWKRIYYKYPESRKGLYLRLAIASALRPPGTGTQGAGGTKKPVDPLDRFAHYYDAHRSRDLMPSFDTLTTWELTHVVSSHASNEDLEWGRNALNTWGPGFRAGEKVGTLTSQMRYQGSQIPYNDMSCLLAGGGKCGPRSSFGVFINQAFGIPSIGVGQPAHAAVSHRDVNGNWQVTYGRGWGVSKLADRYRMSGGDFLERVAERKKGKFAKVEHLRWLTSTMKDQEKIRAVMAAADSIAKDAKILIGSVPTDRSPDVSGVIAAFQTPVNTGDLYGARVRGFIYAPTSGDYTFTVTADDQADLFISTDENPDNKTLIAHLREWAEPTNFAKYPTQTSQPIRLEAGKKYYIEAIHREHTGGDHLIVAWSGPALTQRVIPGSNLSPYPNGRRGRISHDIWRDRPSAPLASARLTEKAEAPFKVARGGIHIEAEDFFTQGGIGGYGVQGVPVENCYDGGKQIQFGALMQAAWVGYKIQVPKSGVYELKANLSVINWGQRLYARSFGTMYRAQDATASDVYHNQHEGLGPKMAIDQDLGTRWAMNLGKEKGWISLDLGQPRKVSKVIIDERGLNQIARFQVDYKKGDTWTKLFGGDSIEAFQKAFPPVMAQHIRLSTFDTRSSTGGPTIWDFSVGDEFDGSGWINADAEGNWTGSWMTTKPIDMHLTAGEQTLWIGAAPNQRGVALRWLELVPKNKSGI